MAAKKSTVSKASVIAPIEPLIREIRGEKVILDTDLAQIYGIPTFRLNEAIKRNRERFPADFMFQLTPHEAAALTSQIAISKKGRGGRNDLKAIPLAEFNERFVRKEIRCFDKDLPLVPRKCLRRAIHASSILADEIKALVAQP